MVGTEVTQEMLSATHVVVIKFLGSVLLLLSVKLDIAEVSNKLHWCKFGFWPLMLICVN